MNNLIILCIVFLIFNLKKKENFSSKINHKFLKNIYGEPLINCNYRDTSDRRGSWDYDGFCSEKGGGVHQICFDVTDTSKNFARHTGQGSNWSSDRKGKNHCMCLGAWANFKAKQQQGKFELDNNDKINKNNAYSSDNELVCDAIPESVFDTRYFNAFNREQPGMWQLWNGEERKVANQASVGLDELVKQCSKRNVSSESKKNLKNKYCSLAKNNPELQSMFYKEYCGSKNQVEYFKDCEELKKYPTSSDSDIKTVLCKFGDSKTIEIIDGISNLSLKNLIRVTHEMCAQMRYSPSISTSKIRIPNKDNTNSMKFYVSVCCSSDYCEFFKNKFYYKKYNNGVEDIYLLFKRRDDKVVQVLSPKYYEEILFPLMKSKKIEKMCKKYNK